MLTQPLCDFVRAVGDFVELRGDDPEDLLRGAQFEVFAVDLDQAVAGSPVTA